ncbi:hypothetical protein CQS04_10325 [Chryseomicrobium excrementi]|uniref:RQC domain-containing protein n=1 Tax=Chryseomicrobium excrementi TaxID=2041346 RepID=A0A2M9EYK8_9BACL|nr:RQC-minor-2 family DNA-binding protein [Chryseomicrobium excrementi]PJK16291.1 hypothetical protein CQS04_10325 [Chryseomicrobium excrementi]
MTYQHLGLLEQPYDSLYLIPVGAVLHVPSNYPSSPPLLRRIANVLKELLSTREQQDHELISRFTKLPSHTFPLAIVSEQQAYMYAIRPDYFLWKKQKPELTLTPDSHHFDTRNLYSLSDNQLRNYFHDLLDSYVFAAQLPTLSRRQWKEKARSAYSQNPFIRLAAEKQDVIKAVEITNRSMLMGVLNPPEDVAFWRHRVEIVLRPYRALPPDATYSACNHPIQVTIDKESPMLHIYCETCNYAYKYDPFEDRVVLQEKINLAQAQKRILTIERQFNALAEGTPKVLAALRKLQQIQRWYVDKEFPEHAGDAHRLIRSLQGATFPIAPVEPTLLSLQHVKLATIDSLRFVQPYLDMSKQQLDQQLEKEQREAFQYQTEDTEKAVRFSTKGYTLYEEEVDVIEDYLARDEQMTFHLLIQVLKGEATSKVRTLNLHRSPIFGLLRPWPKKLIPQAIKSFW